MLDRLQAQSPDALLALIKLHAADPRPDKVDLGVGVYRTGQGDTPVFAAIKACHERVHGMGAPRIHTTIQLGTRTDREQTLEDKVDSVVARLQ